MRARTGYRVKWTPTTRAEDTSDVIWEVEPQVELGPADGVEVWCKPDFVLWPVRGQRRDIRPVAIFLDGWQYHRDNLTDDFIKRMAIQRSGQFVVWSMDYYDVREVLEHKQSKHIWPTGPHQPKLEQMLQVMLKRVSSPNHYSRTHRPVV